MANENTDPTVDSSSVITSADAENAVAEPQPTPNTEGAPAIEEPKQADVMIPSVEADPWANFGKDVVDSTTEEPDTEKPASEKIESTEPAKPTDNSGAAAAPAKEVDEKPKTEDEAEKSLEDQILEEAFGDKAPAAEDPKKPVDPKELTDEELDKLDPQAMIDAQTKAASKRWAQRNAQRASIVNDYIHDTKPIAEVATELRTLKPERYSELAQLAAHELVDSNPEATFQRAFAVAMMQINPLYKPDPATMPKLQDVIQSHYTGTAAAPAVPQVGGHLAPAHFPEAVQTQIAELEKALDGHNWRDPAKDDDLLDGRELALVKTLRELEKNFSSANTPTVKEQDPAANGNGKQPDPQADIQTALAGKLDTEVLEYKSSLQAKVLPWIAKNTGLEINADDTPEVKAFKQSLMIHYEGTPHQKANNLDSDFELFATTESSVADEFQEVYNRVVDLKLKAVIAKEQGNVADAKKFNDEATDARVDIINLVKTANEEFRKLRIDPQLALMGSLSTSLTSKVLEASERVEMTSNGGQAPAQPRIKAPAATAEEVWDRVVEDAAEDDRLRTN